MTQRRPLPVLVDGMGVRDESCAWYRGCFDRWAAEYTKAGQHPTGWAHCPTGCPSHSPKAARREEARMTSSLAVRAPHLK